MIKMLAENTSQPVEKVASDVDRDYYMRGLNAMLDGVKDL